MAEGIFFSEVNHIFEARKNLDGGRKVVEKCSFPTKGSAYKASVEVFNDLCEHRYHE